MKKLTVEVWDNERVVKMADGLMESIFVRDNQGNRLRVEWGEPNSDGTYILTIHVDYTDSITIEPDIDEDCKEYDRP